MSSCGSADPPRAATVESSAIAAWCLAITTGTRRNLSASVGGHSSHAAPIPGDRRLRGSHLPPDAGAQNITNRQNVAGYTWNRGVNAIEVHATGYLPDCWPRMAVLNGKTFMGVLLMATA